MGRPKEDGHGRLNGINVHRSTDGTRIFGYVSAYLDRIGNREENRGLQLSVADRTLQNIAFNVLRAQLYSAGTDVNRVQLHECLDKMLDTMVLNGHLHRDFKPDPIDRVKTVKDIVSSLRKVV